MNVISICICEEGSQSNSLSNWIGASPFLIVQSEALFTKLL